MSRVRALALAALFAALPSRVIAQAQPTDWLLPSQAPSTGGGGGTGTAGAGLTLTGSVFTLGDGLGITYTSPGQLGLIGGIITSNLSQLTTSVTWNNVAITFDAPWLLQVTNTASGSQSKLIDLQVGGASKFSVRSDGLVAAPGTGLEVAALFTTAGAQVASLSSGIFNVAGIIETSGFTVATLPANRQGAHAFVTDQTTACPASGGALTGSGSVVCPVFNNGSAWVGD